MKISLIFLVVCVVMVEHSETSEIHVFGIESEPFFHRDNETGKFKGIEFELVNTFAQKLNLTIIFQNASDDNTDLLIGGLSMSSELRPIADHSIPYFQDELTWCVRNAGYYPIYLNIFLFATPDVWIISIFGFGLGTGFILYIFIQFDTKYKHRNQRDWYYTTLLTSFPAAIGISQRFKPIYGPLRMFYGFMLIIGIIATIHIYTFGIICSKAPTARYQVSTTSEMLENEYYLFGSRDNLRAIQHDPKYSNRQIVTFDVCENIDDGLKHLTDNFSFDWAIGASRHQIINSPTYSPFKFYCFDSSQRIRSFFIASEMRFDYKLKSKFNKIIRNLFEGGLFVKWHRDNKRRGKYEVPFVVSDQVTMHHQGFFFLVIGIGFLASTLAFGLEIMTFKKLKNRNPHWIWIFSERLFDGKRHYLKNLVNRIATK